MKPKLSILLAFIVIAPLVLLAWLGIKVWRDEQEMVRVRVEELLTAQLADVARTVERLIAEQRRELSRAASFSELDSDAIRKIVRRERIVRQLFVVDRSGRLVHPPNNETASAAERAFLTRTERIFSGKLPFLSVPDESTSSKILTSRVQPEGKQEGWYVWYWDEGVNLIFWRRDGTGRVIGAELSRVVLLADIVAALPETDREDPSVPTGRIQLVDANGRQVYGWGLHEPAQEEIPDVTLALKEPLGSWKLQYYTGTAEFADSFSGSMLINLLLGLAAIGLAVIVFAFYFYRESSREFREAKQRVTFVNQVSHELKTPLTNIRMYAELLDDQLDEEEEKPRSHLNVIVSESQRLSRLIANVLSFGRQQQCRLTVRPATAIVDEIVARVIEHFEPSFGSKQIEIAFEGNAKDQVAVDADALGQVMSNLLSNVEKYAASGKYVEVSTKLDGETTTVTVADRGPGIARTARKKIFEPFYRHSIALTEGVTGTGIGLGISRDIARLHGGDLTLLASEKGCQFQVVLHTPKGGRAQ